MFSVDSPTTRKEEDVAAMKKPPGNSGGFLFKGE
jgi:hypothetical protein